MKSTMYAPTRVVVMVDAHIQGP